MNIVIEEQIKTLNLSDLDRHEAECIVYAWLLKTKLYLIGETSHEWSAVGTETLRGQLGSVLIGRTGETIDLSNWDP